MEIPVQPNTAAKHFMHKNRLQEHAQRASIHLPVYTTVNEGSPHAPKFRASVLIDGARFTSPCTFSNRKAAEQEVARVAFEELSMKIKPETIPLIHSDLFYCKSILHEYCAKKKLERPTYNTCALAGSPLFSCRVVFCGIKYTGSIGRSKREAEQVAARAVIESVLGNSEAEAKNCMYEIIKSKCRLIASMHSVGALHLVQDQSMTPKAHVDNLNTTDVIGNKEAAIVLTNDTLPPSSCPGQPSNDVPVESSVSEVNKLEHRSISEHRSTSLHTGCRQVAAIHGISGSHSVQDQSLISMVHVDNLSTTNVVEKEEAASILTNDKLPASIHQGPHAIAVPVESRFSEVKRPEHECIPKHLSTSSCTGESISRLLQSNLLVGANVECHFVKCNLPHDNKLLGTHNLVGSSNPGPPAIAATITSCSAEGTCREGDASLIPLSKVPGISDGSAIGKRKKCKKKKKNKSPSKKIRNEGMPTGDVAHPLAHGAPVNG